MARSPVARGGRRLAALALAALAAAPAALPAQARFILQLGPRPGDTLHLEFEQRTELTGAAREGSPASKTVMGMHVWSRVIAEARSPERISVIAATDSAMAVTSEGTAGAPGVPRRAMVVGQMTRFHLAADGTVRVPDDGTADARELAQSMSVVPATLPPGPVSIGQRWNREMPVAMGGPGQAGKVQAIFQFDSVGRQGELAYLSMKGQLVRDSVPAGPPRGTFMKVAGTMTGSLVLDRRRGWFTRSQFLMVLNSLLVPPAGSGTAPLRFVTRVSQSMWVTDGARPARAR
ncbi:MAG: DUF6263 family protein [Gemmatimonadaceae bacterium]